LTAKDAYFTLKLCEELCCTPVRRGTIEDIEHCPVLETKDKPRISYSEVRGYSEVYPWVKFWHFSILATFLSSGKLYSG